MGLEDYDFKVYESDSLEHLRRHLKDTTIDGSVFHKKYFPTPESVVETALRFIKDYDGTKMERTVDFPHEIGYDGVVLLSELPRNANIRRELRDGEPVNVVYGGRKRRTNRMVIIAGPTKEGGHGFITIYPGKYCPPLSDREFWERHAFIA